MSHSLKSMQFLDTGLLGRAITMADCYVHAFTKHTTVHTPNGYTTCIAGVVEAGDKHLGCSLYDFRSRYHLDYLVKQICYVVCRLLVVGTHPSVLCRTVNDGEIKLVFRRIE